jgi:polyphosphate kinase 2 (PPK2 family)
VAPRYDEINEFEAQQADDGTNMVKLFFHVTQGVQDERLKARIEHPWKRWKVTAEDFRNRGKRGDYVAATQDMFAHTNTRWAPWRVIDGNNKKSARIAALTTIADALERAVPMKPPAADPEVAALAREAFGED